jgi:hypothetical protein
MTTTIVIIHRPRLSYLQLGTLQEGLRQGEEIINLVRCDKPLLIMMSRQAMNIQIVLDHTITATQVDPMILDIAAAETIMMIMTLIIITRMHEVVMAAAEEGDSMFE